MIPKFRVWILNTKEMEKVERINMSSDVITCEIEHAYGALFITGRKPDGVLMQSTGMKDKNGVEIYEGDIVRGVRPNLDNEAETVETIGQVVEDCCEVVIEDEKGTYDPFENYFAIVYQKGKAEIEVIGNIYENPGLMEV